MRLLSVPGYRPGSKTHLHPPASSEAPGRRLTRSRALPHHPLRWQVTTGSGPVFIVGSPRSGTTFFANQLGSLPGLEDIGEYRPHKGSISQIYGLDPMTASRKLRRTFRPAVEACVRTGSRFVEQTPESAFVIDALAATFPTARFVHLLRDGRDVSASLLEMGWLSRSRQDRDEVDQQLGAVSRYWVEPGREEEFVEASDARRAAWAWRRYVEAVWRSGMPVLEVRYEELVQDPGTVAARISGALGVSGAALASALSSAHQRSVARWRRDLSAQQLAEVESEIAELYKRSGMEVREPALIR